MTDPVLRDLTERALGAVEGELSGLNTPRRRADLLHVLSVLQEIWSGSRTDDDLRYWISEYDLDESMGIDLDDLSRRGVL